MVSSPQFQFFIKHIEKLHPEKLPLKKIRTKSSESDLNPDQDKGCYRTLSLARRTGAADDTDEEELPSEILGLDSPFTAKHYLSLNLRDMAQNYDVS